MSLFSVWVELMASLIVFGPPCDLAAFLPGADYDEWKGLSLCDYDWVDRLYVEAETIGGA